LDCASIPKANNGGEGVGTSNKWRDSHPKAYDGQNSKQYESDINDARSVQQKKKRMAEKRESA
jgi:hypothetical protein